MTVYRPRGPDRFDIILIMSMMLCLSLGWLVMAQGCDAQASQAPEVNPDLCQVWVYPPGYLPVLWTCTAGTASVPPRLPCVQGAAEAGEWSVKDCAQCTPAELLKLDPNARCTPRGESLPAKWGAWDGGEDLAKAE